MGHSRYRVTARPVWSVTAAAAAATLALAACGTPPAATPSAGGTAPSTGDSYGWFAYAGTRTGDTVGVAGEHGIPGPVDALERADLRLPDHADVRQVATQTFTGSAESYLFVFRVSAADAVDFCGQGGLGGAGPVPAIPQAVAEALDHPAVTAGSRWCAGPAPTDPRWSRYAVIVPGAQDGPTTVHLLLQRAP